MNTILFLFTVTTTSVLGEYTWIVDAGSSGMKLNLFVNKDETCPTQTRNHCGSIKTAKLIDLYKNSGKRMRPTLANYGNFLRRYSIAFLGGVNANYISYATAGNRIEDMNDDREAWQALREELEAKRLVPLVVPRTLHGTEEAQWEFLTANEEAIGVSETNFAALRNMFSVGGASAQLALVINDVPALFTALGFFAKTENKIKEVMDNLVRQSCNVEEKGHYFLGLFKYDPDQSSRDPFLPFSLVHYDRESIILNCLSSDFTKADGYEKLAAYFSRPVPLQRCIIFISFLSDTGASSGFVSRCQSVNAEVEISGLVETCASHRVGGLDQTSRLMSTASNIPLTSKDGEININTIPDSLEAWNRFISQDCLFKVIKGLFHEASPFPHAKYVPVGTFHTWRNNVIDSSDPHHPENSLVAAERHMKSSVETKKGIASFSGIHPYLLEFLVLLGIMTRHTFMRTHGLRQSYRGLDQILGVEDVPEKLDWAIGVAKSFNLKPCGLDIHLDWGVEKCGLNLERPIFDSIMDLEAEVDFLI